jgi:hypothetical protein
MALAEARSAPKSSGNIMFMNLPPDIRQEVYRYLEDS